MKIKKTVLTALMILAVLALIIFWPLIAITASIITAIITWLLKSFVLGVIVGLVLGIPFGYLACRHLEGRKCKPASA